VVVGEHARELLRDPAELEDGCGGHGRRFSHEEGGPVARLPLTRSCSLRGRPGS
jgi:hypothetical protein